MNQVAVEATQTLAEPLMNRLASVAADGAPPLNLRVLTVGDWPLSRVHATLATLFREGYLLCAAVEDGVGGLEIWLLKENAKAA